MATKKKSRKVLPWVKRLVLSKGACMNGAVYASRFASPTVAWRRTQNPYDLLWALCYYDEAESRSANEFAAGWHSAVGSNRKTERKLANVLRTRHNQPEGFR